MSGLGGCFIQEVSLITILLTKEPIGISVRWSLYSGSVLQEGPENEVAIQGGSTV